MRTDDTLLLQALKLKQLHTQGWSGPDLIQQLTLQNPGAAKEKMRNICAFISVPMFEKVEEIGSLLDLSKRQMVEMAIMDFCAKADAVIAQHVTAEGA